MKEKIFEEWMSTEMLPMRMEYRRASQMDGNRNGEKRFRND
jgi:hypothetical protein